MSTIRKIADAVREAMKLHPKGLPLNEDGQLVPDPVPMAPPIGFKAQPSMMEMIRAQVLEVSREAARQGFETEEQADDFDVGDDYEPHSPYELDEESEVPIRVLKTRADQAQLDYLEAKRQAGLRMQSDSAGPDNPQKVKPPEGAKPEKPPEGADSA